MKQHPVPLTVGIAGGGTLMSVTQSSRPSSSSPSSSRWATPVPRRVGRRRPEAPEARTVVSVELAAETRSGGTSPDSGSAARGGGAHHQDCIVRGKEKNKKLKICNSWFYDMHNLHHHRWVEIQLISKRLDTTDVSTILFSLVTC